VDDDGRIPLHWAVDARNDRTCRLLFENGSPANVPEKKEEAPLAIAQLLRDRAILVLLLK
jgi:ankyrin repeat protein